MLGFKIFLSSFEIAFGKENTFQSFDESANYNFSIARSSVDKLKNSSAEELKAEDIFLTLKIFADKQYDYDQKIYIAEGNVSVILNDGNLKSDLLRYDKLTGILSAQGNVRFTKGDQYFRGKEFSFDLFKKEGFIKDVYGILDLKNVLEDLQINSNSEILEKNKSIDKRKNTYYDGIEFSFGNIKTLIKIRSNP